MRHPPTKAAPLNAGERAGRVNAGPLPVMRLRPAHWLPGNRLVPATVPSDATVPGMEVSYRTDGGFLVVTLRGALDATSAPALREFLLRILRPALSRLVIDLSAVSHADVRGLTVLVGTGRRARLLDGFLRLAAPVPAVTSALTASGLDSQLDLYPTVQAAMTCPVPA
jgi:anti-sigma B factor antagonist